jgi:hypothetical protein
MFAQRFPEKEQAAVATGSAGLVMGGGDGAGNLVGLVQSISGARLGLVVIAVR